MVFSKPDPGGAIKDRFRGEGFQELFIYIYSANIKVTIVQKVAARIAAVTMGPT